MAKKKWLSVLLAVMFVLSIIPRRQYLQQAQRKSSLKMRTIWLRLLLGSRQIKHG